MLIISGDKILVRTKYVHTVQDELCFCLFNKSLHVITLRSGGFSCSPKSLKIHFNQMKFNDSHPKYICHVAFSLRISFPLLRDTSFKESIKCLYNLMYPHGKTMIVAHYSGIIFRSSCLHTQDSWVAWTRTSRPVPRLFITRIRLLKLCFTLQRECPYLLTKASLLRKYVSIS